MYVLQQELDLQSLDTRCLCLAQDVIIASIWQSPELLNRLSHVHLHRIAIPMDLKSFFMATPRVQSYEFMNVRIGVDYVCYTLSNRIDIHYFGTVCIPNKHDLTTMSWMLPQVKRLEVKRYYGLPNVFDQLPALSELQFYWFPGRLYPLPLDVDPITNIQQITIINPGESPFKFARVIQKKFPNASIGYQIITRRKSENVL
jgi:hypothetical protein